MAAHVLNERQVRMLRNRSIRRGVSALALAALLIPGFAFAQTTDTAPEATSPDSLVGALLALACGASINVARVSPQPIVCTVTVVVCALAMIDAVMTPDPH